MVKKEEKKTVDQLIKDLNTKFGENSVVKLSDSKVLQVAVIPTGSFSLDSALGVGGLPKGRIVEIYGPEGGGKTTLALSVISNAQKQKGNAAFIDIECTFDPIYAEKMGVNISDLVLHQPNTTENSAEEALNIVEGLMSSNLFDVIVIDSVAALEPKAEMDATIGVQTMGLKARLMSQAMRKLAPLAYKTNTLLIFINQVRMKIGQQAWGNPETTPGGNALKFHSSVRIDIRRISTIKDEEESVGIAVKAKITKNKVAPPYRQADFVILFGEGISEMTDVFNIAVEKGIIEKKGNTYSYGEEKLGVGVKNAINELKTNKVLSDKIIERIKTEDIK